MCALIYEFDRAGRDIRGKTFNQEDSPTCRSIVFEALMSVPGATWRSFSRKAVFTERFSSGRMDFAATFPRPV